MKKAISIILSLVLIVCAMAFVNVSASAYYDYDYYRTYSYFTYYISDGQAIIYECDEDVSGNVTIPSTLDGYPVTIIDYEAFYDCDSLESVTIPSSVTSIGYEAFYSCDSLTTVTMSDSATYIGDSVFSSSPVKELIVADGSKTITDAMLESLYNIEKVTIPSSVTSISSYAFEGCYDLTTVYIKDLKAWCEIDFQGSYANPMYYADNLYLNGAAITGDLVIPEGITKITDYAFRNTNISSVTIPNSVTSIGEAAFANCKSLKSVTFLSGVKSVGCDAFYGCEALEMVNITDLKAWCEIEFDCYYYYDDYYDDYDYDYDANPLYYAKKLYLNGSLIQGDLAIPEGTTKINDYVFYGCESISSITIPSTVTTIGEAAFFNCTSSLKTITVNSNNQKYCTVDGVLFDKEQKTLILYPCKNERSIYIIPNGVETISSYAFYNCENLTSITIPKSVVKIGYSAFDGCRWITYVYYDGNDVLWDRIDIYDGNSFITTAYINYNHVHSYSSSITQTATCSQAGIQLNSCACGHYYTNEIPALGHTPNVVGVVKSTYFAAGHTGNKVCSACGVVVEKGKKVAKLVLKTSTFKVTAGKSQFKVKYTKVAGATGFQVRYKLKGKWITKTFNVKKNATKAIKKLKKGTYQVQTRVMGKNGKKKAFTAWSKTQKVKVK